MIRGRALGWAVVSVLLLALVWAAAPRDQLPLYDGVGFPDEPYRWVERPPGAPHTLLASDLIQRFPVGGRTNQEEVQAQTAEQGPQAVVWILAGGLAGPSDDTSGVLRAAPIGPVSPPAGGTLYSNIYRISAATPSGAMTLSKIRPAAAVFLRGPQATDRRVQLELHSEGRWIPVEQTQRNGQDIWGGYITTLGDYALVISGSAPAATQGQPASPGASTVAAAAPEDSASQAGAGARPLLLSLGSVALILGAAVVMIRIRRRARKVTSEGPG